MTPAAIIEQAKAEGLTLSISQTGAIGFCGNRQAAEKWTPTIREHKAEIIDVLKVGDTATASRWWLLHFPNREPLEVWTSGSTHAAILKTYPDAVAAEPFTPTVRRPSAPLAGEEETAIRAWLASIGEADPTTIAEVIGRCRIDAGARDYLIGRAAELPGDAPSHDDLRTCGQCANLMARQCLAAKRGEIAASRNYEPIRDLPRRCEGYAPGTDDPDRRHGRERWPGLTDAKGTK